MTATCDRLREDLLELYSHLVTQNGGGAWGWLYSSTKNSVSYSDPDAREKVQHELDHLAGTAIILAQFALVEEYWPTKRWTLDLVDADDLERLLAFRHIRNSAAHSGTYGRATRNTDEIAAFDSVMMRSNSDGRIQGVTRHSKDEIQVDQSAGSDLVAFTQRVVQLAVARHHNKR